MLEILSPVRLLGLPGSLRQASFSRATLIGLRDSLPEKVTLEIHEPQLPLYNEDDDRSNGPEQVLKFRDAIKNSDGVVIVTPEYNHGVPGVLKNALDWASRPFGRSVLAKKPTLAISVSSAFTGGVRAHAQLNETLLAIPALVAGGPQIVIGNIGEKIADGVLVDQPSLHFALAALRQMISMCRLSSSRLMA
ncbi:NADPH-dependent FMN reductase [Bradyrhizobium erythrophlei]|jgi:chromate reductase|uniref:Chromate reductase n=1 Tax=Bradyrhizobium erythrophlei TaxID=1437360 RepID=A0A1M7TDU3_9BRAD|nr:NAD(P)H-dependent oxidoreductase [Bradyrhizobium erythrophlei]SHN68847.1 chromate reductase [Bradyrhizobium erythrophlei]